MIDIILRIFFGTGRGEERLAIFSTINVKRLRILYKKNLKILGRFLTKKTVFFCFFPVLFNVSNPEQLEQPKKTSNLEKIEGMLLQIAPIF